MPSITSRRLSGLALSAVAVLGLSACASDADEPAAAPVPDGPAQVGTELFGFVGLEDQPEAFEIGITDAEGRPVSTVEAGSYSLVVDDRAQSHNFRISGDGVDEATDVGEVEEKTFTLELLPGTYTYICDPHPNMTGTLTVT